MIRSLRVRALRGWFVAVAAFAAGGCASALQSGPLPILEGSWDMLATVDGVDYAGLLTFAPDGLVVWDGDREVTLGPEESAYLAPMAEHALEGDPEARVLVVRVEGELDEELLREYAGYDPAGRARAERDRTRWY